MRLGILTALAGIFVIATVLVAGCSGDDNATTPVVYGDNNDPAFIPVKAQIDSTLEGMVDGVLDGFNNLTYTPGDTSTVQAQLMPPGIDPGDQDPDQIITTYENGWYYVYATYTGNSYSSVLMDSIQFQIDGTPVENPSGSDYIHTITNWILTADNQDITHVDYSGRSDFTFSNLNTDIATIAGNYVSSVHAAYVNGDSTFTGNFTFNCDVTNYTVSRTPTGWISGCPNTGTVTFDLSYSFSWNNGQSFGFGSSNWTATVVFVSGTATVTVGNGNTTWQYTVDVCNPGQA